MKYDWTVARDREGRMYLRTMGDGGGGKPRAVCTVADAVRRLGRSQRHIYRYMREGVLKPRGRFLGQWLLDPGEVELLALMPRNLRRPPRRFRVFFPEYDARAFNPYRDWRSILGPLLDLGGPEEIGWALRHYPLPLIRRFVEDDGSRRLSSRSLRFWSLYCGATPKRASRPSRHWGGLS